MSVTRFGVSVEKVVATIDVPGDDAVGEDDQPVETDELHLLWLRC
jgi:hypothetical protein